MTNVAALEVRMGKNDAETIEVEVLLSAGPTTPMIAVYESGTGAARRLPTIGH